MSTYTVELSNGETVFQVLASSIEEAGNVAVGQWLRNYGESVTAFDVLLNTTW